MVLPIPPWQNLDFFGEGWNRPIASTHKAQSPRGQALTFQFKHPAYEGAKREIVGPVKVLPTNFSLTHTVGGQDVPVEVISLSNAFTSFGGYVTFEVASSSKTMTIYGQPAMAAATLLQDEPWSTLFLDTGKVTQLVILTGADRDHSIESYQRSRTDVVSDELRTALLKAEVSVEAAREILVTARSFLREHGFPNASYTVEDRFDMEDELWLVTARFIIDVPLERAMELDFDLAKRLVASHDELPYRFIVAIDAA